MYDGGGGLVIRVLRRLREGEGTPWSGMTVSFLLSKGNFRLKLLLGFEHGLPSVDEVVRLDFESADFIA